jgi:hypothetical protein
MATLGELRDRVLAKTGQANDGALDPALSVVIDEAVNSALEALAVEAQWLEWRRTVPLSVASGQAYVLLPEARRRPGVVRVDLVAGDLRYPLAGGLVEWEASPLAVGLPTRWAIATAWGLVEVVVADGGASGAVLGDPVAITTPAVPGSPAALAVISAETAGVIAAVDVVSSGWGLPPDTQVTAPTVPGSSLMAVLEEVQAIRLDCPLSQPATLLVEMDLSVARLEAEGDVCPIDAEVVALWAASLACATNGWPGEGNLQGLALRRLQLLRARTSPGVVASLVPPQPARPRGRR